MLTAQTNFRIGLKHFLVTVSVFLRNVLLALKYIHCNKSVVCNTEVQSLIHYKMNF